MAFQGDAFQNDAFQTGAGAGTSFTAYAVLRATLSAGFTADAILRVPRSGSFTADSLLRRTIAGTFTVDATIGNVGGFTADAAIGRLIFSDDFTRSVTGHLGGPWSWYWYDAAYLNSKQTSTAVNGSEAVFSYNDGIESWVGLPRAATGAIYFDFFVPAGAQFDEEPTIGVNLDTDSYTGIYVRHETGGDWQLLQFGADTPTSFTPDLGTWYRLHAMWTATTVLMNAWKRSDPEPAGWMYDQPIEFDPAGGAWSPPFLDLYLISDPDARVDNVEVWTNESTWKGYGGFQLDAAIRASRAGSLLANSILRRAQPGSFTVDAVIDPIWRPLTVDAVIFKSVQQSFTASAWIYAPRADPDGPGEPGETPLVSILVGGVDITRYVVLSDATFTMLVNGGVGNFRFRVRDDAHQFTFVTGQEVTLDIDGRRKFGGYLIQPKRMLAFPVVDTTDPEAPSRFHVLEGVDYNYLMTKRVLYRKDDPANVALRSWPVGSRSDDVIRYTFENYTDLSDDGISTDGVLDVGSPNPDQAGVIGSGGLRFLDAMREINRLISGVYYIDPFKVLHFVDVDTPDAEVGLSDKPGVGQVGYRELAQTENGTRLINDALLWGAGQGSRNLKFGRSTDAPSIAAHKLWQYGEFATSLYRQASVNTRVASIVYGTEQGKRGGKDDAEIWNVVTYEKSFTVGQKVEIESVVFGKSDVVPIRRMTITFPSKRKPKFELALSHEIDEPWNMFEFWFPPFPPFPPFDPRIDIDIDIPRISDCECGVTDLFSREIVDGWGTSDIGEGWGIRLAHGLSGAAAGSVSGGLATLEIDNSGGLIGSAIAKAALSNVNFDALLGEVTYRFKVDDMSAGGSVGLFFTTDLVPNDALYTNPGFTNWLNISFGRISTGPSTGKFGFFLESRRSGLSSNNGGVNGNPYVGTNGPVDAVAGTWYNVKLVLEPWVGNPARLTPKFKIWNAALEDEPTGWEDSGDGGNGVMNDAGPIQGFGFVNYGVSGLVRVADFSTLYVVGLDRCDAGPVYDEAGRLLCYPGGPPSIDGSPTGGDGRSDQIGTGAQTVFVTGIPYEPGSTRVFVGGYFQRPGIEYTETDPEAGEITFTVAPTLLTLVTIFYEAVRTP